MYIEFNERTDLLVSIKLCLMCIRSLSDDSAHWKWAILSLHNALQGAMVCHLSGTANIGALSNKSADAMLEWFERGRRGEINTIDVGIDDELGIPKVHFATAENNLPKEHLADARTLFNRLSNEDGRYEVGVGEVLVITNSQRDSFLRLHKLRNDFAHFTPKGWSIELAGLPGIFLNMVEVLDNISADDWSFSRMDSLEREQLRILLQELKEELSKADKGKG